MDDGTGLWRNVKTTNVTKSYIGQKIVKRHNRLRPEGLRHIEQGAIEKDM